MTASPILVATSSSVMIHRDDQQIRAQFLQSLGITRTPMVSNAVTEVNTTRPRHRRGNSLLSSDTTEAALKYNYEDIFIVHKVAVSFCETVAVREIPSHRDYEPADKAQLWNGAQALAATVQRNKLEFTAENYDFEQVLEEDAFVQMPTGELVHPATYQQDQKVKKQERLRRKQLQQKKKQQAAGYGYKSITQILSFASAAPAPKAKSRSRRSKNNAIRRKQHSQKMLMSMAAVQ